MTEEPGCVVLRLAAPVQSWGIRGQFNRRDTHTEPTKSGLVGLLAAALGRDRLDPIADLVALPCAVRTDQAGSLLRDYHTVGDSRGLGLPTAKTDPTGRQQRRVTAAPQLTWRFYLQDAVFVAAVEARSPVREQLIAALRRPRFPLALGRRACPPTQPLVLPSAPGVWAWAGAPLEVLSRVPWQAGPHARARRYGRGPRRIDLPVLADDSHGEEIRDDLPTSFDPRHRGFGIRRVRRSWVRLEPPDDLPMDLLADDQPHDPFALLGW
jgi:CRISPR system Cascade subunit CasD